jgi:hypothetical protein
MVNKSKKINADFDTLRTQASIRMPQHTTQPAFTSRGLSDPKGCIEGHAEWSAEAEWNEGHL